MLQNQRAYSTLFWIGFLTFCLIPLMALAVNVGRFFFTRAALYQAADSAALAAAQEVNVEVYRNTGQIVLLPSAYPAATHYANLSSSYLTTRRIYPYITSITVEQASRTVHVEMAAQADELVPLIGNVNLHARAEAQVRGEIFPP
jgi:putative Flp pilus-assembly TadE/G-like protein